MALQTEKMFPSKIDTVRTFPAKKEFEHISKLRNKEAGFKFLVDVDTSLRDFYYHYKPTEQTAIEKKAINRYENMEALSDSAFQKIKNNYHYEMYFTNKGGCVMPLIIQFNFKDGSSEINRIDAYVWRKNEKNVIKTFSKSKEVTSIILDPYKETADIDERNNSWNTVAAPNRFDVFKTKTNGARGQSNGGNPMQKAKGK